jgi:hypothetical protein
VFDWSESATCTGAAALPGVWWPVVTCAVVQEVLSCSGLLEAVLSTAMLRSDSYSPALLELRRLPEKAPAE